MNEDLTAFTTDEGREIRLRAVGLRLVQQVLGKYPEPPVPTYEVQLVGGGTQSFPHDEESAKQSGLTGEWAAYRESCTDSDARKMQELSEFLLYNCVIDEPSPTAEWSVDFALWGLDSPDPADKRAYKLFWIENELCPGPHNLSRLLGQLYQLVGLFGKDLAKEFESFFRLTMARLLTS